MGSRRNPCIFSFGQLLCETSNIGLTLKKISELICIFRGLFGPFLLHGKKQRLPELLLFDYQQEEHD